MTESMSEIDNLCKRYGMVLETSHITNEPDAMTFYFNGKKIGAHTGGPDVALEWLKDYISTAKLEPLDPGQTELKLVDGELKLR